MTNFTVSFFLSSLHVFVQIMALLVYKVCITPGTLHEQKFKALPKLNRRNGFPPRIKLDL